MHAPDRVAVQVEHEDQVVEAGLRAVLRAQPAFALEAPSSGRGPSAAGRVIVTDHAAALALAAGAGGREPASGRLIVFALSEREPDIRAALEAGVHGYLVLGCSAEEVVRGVSAVARGLRFLCSSASLLMADSIAHASLTVREGEILALLSQGFSNKAIARELDLAIGTVKAHVRAVLSKLGARSRTEAASMASRRGLVAAPGAAAPAWRSQGLDERGPPQVTGVPSR